MKKSLTLVLALIVVLAFVITGCSAPAPAPSASPSVSPAATTSASPAAASPAAETKKVKAGFIYIGPADDGGFSTSHDNGRKYVEQKLGIETVFKELVPESSEINGVIDNMVDQGCNMIFTCSYGYMDYTEAKAKEYPDVIFLHCSGSKSNGTNFINYFGRIEQARFLTGLAAGKATKTNKIGYVAAFAIPEVNRGIDAFALGVAAVNPKATVEVLWTGNWVDATIAKEGAKTLIAKGCDVIAQHQDATSPQVAAEEATKAGNPVYSVGYHMDMLGAAPTANIASAVWNWGPYYEQVIKSVMDGKFDGKNYWGGMKDGVVDVVITKNAPEGVQALVDQYKAKIIDGSFDVFAGPLTDNKGNVIIKAGEKLTDEQQLGIMWLNANVIGEVKQ
jgi:basic membrane protein A and related proteins